jgi:RNA polymerase sigma-70 factor (ECF subfamily)
MPTTATACPPSTTAPGAHDALVEQIARCGDTRAFENLFRHYAPRLKGVGIRSGIPAGVAEELAQETMISVWRRAPTFERSRGGASRWIFAIFRNKRIDYLRRNPPCETALDDILCLRSDDDDPETSADLRSMGRILQRALQALPPNQAEALLEVYYAGRSHAEAASRLNLPVGTVKSRIRLALAKIRTSLELSEETNQLSPAAGASPGEFGAGAS